MIARALLLAAIGVSAAARAATAPAPPDDLAREALADGKRDELIRDLEAILPRMAGSDRRADLEFQLAELWWEKARRAGQREIRQHDEAWTKWAEAGRKG